MSPSPLGQKIRRLRKEKGLSLEELAARGDVSKSYLWTLENKESPNPSTEKLLAIARALEVTPEFLLDGTKDVPDSAEQDRAFFRQYQSADPSIKRKIAEILKVLDSKDG
jgi:transcriptional regulator with XRE-family HTH domain